MVLLARDLGPQSDSRVLTKAQLNANALGKLRRGPGRCDAGNSRSATDAERADTLKLSRATGERTISKVKVLLSAAEELKLNARARAERGALSERGLATEMLMANIASSLANSVLEAWNAAGGRDGCAPEEADPDAMQDAITAGNSLLERAKITHLVEPRGYAKGSIEADSICGQVARVENEVFVPVRRLLAEPAEKLNLSKKLPELESLRLISESEAKDGTFS